MLNDTITHEISYQSPFHLEENWSIHSENHNKNCTFAELDSLISKGILNTIDLEIIKLLGRWSYINTHNISLALNDTLPLAYQKPDYRSNLRKLVNAGIIIRHFIFSADASIAPTPITPLRFYSLSPGAFSYISPQIETAHKQRLLLTDIQIIEALAVSQFMIQLLANNHLQIKHCRTQITRIINHSPMLIPAEFTVTCSSHMPRLNIHVLCARGNKQSISNVISGTRVLLECISKQQDSFSPHMIIILAESMHEIPSVHKGTLSSPCSSCIYYTTDQAIFTDVLFNALYQCDESNGHLAIMRIKMRDTLIS